MEVAKAKGQLQVETIKSLDDRLTREIQSTRRNPIKPGEPPEHTLKGIRSATALAAAGISVSVNLTTVADANVGTATFAVWAWFDETIETMNTSVAPTISFSVENPTGTLTFNAGASGWFSTTYNVAYVARFDVADANVTIPNLDVRVTGAKDVAGNTQTQADFTEIFSIDTQNPTVAISRQTPATSPTNANSVTFLVDFNEDVQNVDAADFILALGGTVTTGALSVGNGGDSDASTYTVTVPNVTGDGTLDLDFAAGQNIQDLAGNAFNAGTGITSEQTYTISHTRTWDGGNGVAGNNWMTAANWAYDVAPVAGDRLVFAGVTQTSTYNDFDPGTTFDSIQFASGGFTLSGNSVKLTPVGGVAIDNVAGQNRIDLPITSDSTGTTIVQAGTPQLGLNAQSLVLNGVGADIRGGSLVFDYTGGSTPAGTILTDLTASWNLGVNPWTTGKFQSSTAVVNNWTLGWIDDTLASAVIVTATIPGDFNLDGKCNNQDYAIWLANNTRINMVWAEGDANYDGKVNNQDYAIWLTNNTRQFVPAPDAPVGAGGVGAAVPGPGTPSPLAGQNAAIPSKPVPLAAGGSAASVGARTAAGNPARGADQASLMAASALYVGAGRGISLNPGPTRVGGIDLLPIAQNQMSSIPAAQAKPTSTLVQTNKSSAPTARVPLGAAALLAHDAVFGRLETERCGVVDGLLENGGSDAGLVAAGLDLGRPGISPRLPYRSR